MIKTTYFCDCCKQIIPDDHAHIQLALMLTSGETVPGYSQLTEAHFCKDCTDRIISFAFNPVDIEAMKKGIDESNGIIDALNAELEEIRKAHAEQFAEEIPEVIDPPAPATAKAKCRMAGKRSPVDKQQVIRLYRDGHMTYQQIADRVGCAVSIVYGIVSKYNKSAPALEAEPAEEHNE